MITFSLLLESLKKPKAIAAFKLATKHITAVDSRDNAWMFSLKDLMDSHDWHPLGTGKYGAVFGKSGYPYIIKVFMKDTAYLKWLDYAKKNQDNPYVPKIKGKVVRLGTHFMAVRLEKLVAGGSPIDLYRDATNGNKDAKAIVNFLKANTNLLDLHDGNVMKRGKQLVITDPVYNYFNASEKKFTIDPEDVSEFTSIL